MNINKKQAILVLGSILLDIYEDTGECFLGGAEFNFAYHLEQLIQRVDFVGRVGDDHAGKFILDELESRNFPTNLIQIDPLKSTKTVKVLKDSQNEPQYIIASDVAAEYLDIPSLSEAELASYNLVYFGTTLQHGQKSQATLRHILPKCQGIKFFDINLRPPKYTLEIIDYSLNLCNVLKLNHAELATISEIYQIPGRPEEQLVKLAEKFSIATICLTLAQKGSLLLHKGQLTSKQLTLNCPVIDTVGAGDGFSACLAIGLIRDWQPDKILNFASDFAAAICQIKGAVPPDKSFYNNYISRV